jgi:hypothetical protein
MFWHQNLEDENEVMQGLRSTLRSCWVSIVNALQEWQDSRARKAFSGRPHHLPGAACCPTGFGTRRDGLQDLAAHCCAFAGAVRFSQPM